MRPERPPRLDRLWRQKPICAERRRRVGDALEHIHAVGKAALHVALPGRDNCLHVYPSFNRGKHAPEGARVTTVDTSLIVSQFAGGCLDSGQDVTHSKPTKSRLQCLWPTVKYRDVLDR